MDSSLTKCHKRRSFLPKHLSSTLIKALFTLIGVGINFKPLDNKEIYALDKILVNKLITFGLTNLAFNRPFITSAILFSPILSCALLSLMFNLIRTLSCNSEQFRKKDIIQS